MKFQYTILCWLFFCSSTYSQIVWQQHFNEIQTDIISMFSIEADNSISMIGIENEQTLSYSFNAQKSIKSTSSFTKKLPFTPDAIYSINAQNYIIIHNHDKGLTYAQVNDKGKVAWTKEFITTAKISRIIITQSKDILMVGTKKGQMFAVLLDTNNKVVWEQLFGGSGQIYDVVEDKNGDFILVGFVDLFQSGETDFFITKMNAKGKNLWEKVLGSPEFLNEKARLVTITPQGKILIVGHRNNNIWMVQMQADNQTVTWETEVKETGFGLMPTQLVMLKDGNVLITNMAKKEDKSNLYIIQANTELMTAAKKWSASFTLETENNLNQNRLNVHFKEAGNYYRVSSNIDTDKEVQLYGKYPKGNFVYVLGLNRQGVMGIVSEPTSKGGTSKMNATIDVEMYQFLIVLVSNTPCNIQKIRNELSKEKRVITALPKVLGNRFTPFEDIQYRNSELGASTRLANQGVVAFFVQLK